MQFLNFRISSAQLVLAAIAGFIGLVNTAPLVRRQIGSVQCNLDRLQIVVDLQESADAVNELATELMNTTSSANVTVAQTGIHDAQLAIDQIVAAIFANQTADPALRDQVGNNITIAFEALLGINTTCPTANATLTNAISLIQESGNAGNDVLRDCTA
ncbi:hypothetical protein BV25DRAFT_635866 [Artomyces pyxidatus]|uniref:Uncharacterized protein n=1 Tax=Artomyces pyxidatus TaxID=48021 RepID=A0ACB8T1U3_9AGAM|nr:hypothetical protein BV25DRAFT_635866 [Artomyces pyxidatus]